MSLEEAIEMVRNAILYDKELYKKLIECIENGIIDSTNDMILGNIGKLARGIADHLLGRS